MYPATCISCCSILALHSYMGDVPLKLALTRTPATGRKEFVMNTTHVYVAPNYTVFMNRDAVQIITTFPFDVILEVGDVATLDSLPHEYHDPNGCLPFN